MLFLKNLAMALSCIVVWFGLLCLIVALGMVAFRLFGTGAIIAFVLLTCAVAWAGIASSIGVKLWE